MRDVAVCVCVGGTVSSGFYVSLTRILLSDALAVEGRIREHITEGSGVNVSMARNRLVDKFLRSGATWAWMLDADMVLRPDTLDGLLDAADPIERPFVGALCYGMREDDGSAFSTTYAWEGELGSEDETFTQRDLIPGFGTVRVGATGVACALVHRDVFIETEDTHSSNFPWFQEVELASGKYAGEDIEFMRKCRAAGVPVYVNTSAAVGHDKSQIVDERVWLAQKLGA